MTARSLDAFTRCIARGGSNDPPYGLRVPMVLHVGRVVSTRHAGAPQLTAASAFIAAVIVCLHAQ